MTTHTLQEKSHTSTLTQTFPFITNHRPTSTASGIKRVKPLKEDTQSSSDATGGCPLETPVRLRQAPPRITQQADCVCRGHAWSWLCTEPRAQEASYNRDVSWLIAAGHVRQEHKPSLMYIVFINPNIYFALFQHIFHKGLM